MAHTIISDFGYLLLFIIGAIVFVAISFGVSSIIRSQKPNFEKLQTYECGEEAIGNAWGQFNIRFYIIALVFVLFEVELVFLFPWATVFGNETLIEQTHGLWGWFALFEVFAFVIILTLGLIYVWKKGFLDWVKPKPQTTQTISSSVPPKIYEEFNKRYSQKSP